MVESLKWIHWRWRNFLEGHGAAGDWIVCLFFLRNRLIAKIIFYSHLPAMEGLKTGRNEKRYFRNRWNNEKKNMQINILPSGICKQILTEWLLKKLGRSSSQSSCPNSRCSKMDGQMIKWHLNCNPLGSTEAWPLVPFFATFFPDSVYVIPWCDKEGMREIHFCFTIAALQIFVFFAGQSWPAQDVAGIVDCIDLLSLESWLWELLNAPGVSRIKDVFFTN